jgi:putative membrane protein
MPRLEVQPTAETHFSWLRTRLSTERTLMSCVRTATALIGFGFTIFQFFESLHPVRSQAPRYLGLALIGAGVVFLAVALWEYALVKRYLWGPPFDAIAGLGREPWHTPMVWVTVLLLAIGLAAFVWLLLR